MKERISAFVCFIVIFVLCLNASLVCAENVFPDVPSSHTNSDAIKYVQSMGIVQGYPDGTYKPDISINRAEFTKIIIGAQFDAEEIDNCLLKNSVGTHVFPDVINNAWFSKYICTAKLNRVINGYPDGTFKPAQNISFVEAAKIIVIAFGYETTSDDIWYKPFVEKLGDRMSIPKSITAFTYNITRGEMAEMIYRLKNTITDKESWQYDDLIPEETGSVSTHFDIPNVDTNEVRKRWLSWYNQARTTLGKHVYKFDDRLNASAIKWSQYMADQGNISHKRPGQTAYYDYNIIKNWFLDLGLDFKNVYRVTFSENIGSGGYSCSKSDCTEDFIKAIRSTFDFYMGEKHKDYKPHYNSLTNAYFNDIGLGIVVEKAKYYLTVHYGTEIL